jgi:transcriptional regulator with XRE-family HTH domain
MLSKLREMQLAHRWTDQEMADRLGVARSTWTEIKNHRLPLSDRVQIRAAGAFPELLADLLTTVSNSGPASAA